MPTLLRFFPTKEEEKKKLGKVVSRLSAGPIFRASPLRGEFKCCGVGGCVHVKKSVSGSFWMCKSERERTKGVIKIKIKTPSGSEVAWLDSQRLQSCDIPFGLSCHTLIFLPFSSLRPRSIFVMLPWSFFAYSRGLVPFSPARVVRLFFFSLSRAFFFKIIILSLPGRRRSISGLSPRYIFFLSCWPLHDKFLLSWAYIRFYGQIKKNDGYASKWMVPHRTGVTARCHWGRKSQLRNHRSFLIGWFIRADLHKLLGGTSERPLKLGAASTWKFVHKVLEG